MITGFLVKLEVSPYIIERHNYLLKSEGDHLYKHV
jgi:hypothetical protein